MTPTVTIRSELGKNFASHTALRGSVGSLRTSSPVATFQMRQSPKCCVKLFLLAFDDVSINLPSAENEILLTGATKPVSRRTSFGWSSARLLSGDKVSNSNSKQHEPRIIDEPSMRLSCDAWRQRPSVGYRLSLVIGDDLSNERECGDLCELFDFCEFGQLKFCARSLFIE